MSKQSWSIEEALHTYQVSRWSEGYFTINNEGHVCAQSSNDIQIDMAKVIDEMKNQNVAFPCVIRFQDIIKDQVHKLNHTFERIIKEAKFKGSYSGVYPIKVNQLREVVEEVVEAGSQFSYGLECGSKAELLTVLAYNNNKNSLTILNGYKDEEYIKLAIAGTKLGKKTVVVIEKLSEIYTVIKAAKELGAAPLLGVRAKLNSKGSGKWTKSSGDNAKFGLNVSEILDLVQILKDNSLLDQLKLFHFHVGSQIPDIRSIKDCLSEGARIFCELQKLDAKLEYFDVGGGVGLNYDGSRSNCSSSTNYTLEDYVGDVVYILRDSCNGMNIAHPTIVSETGRAVSAHHSCVVTNVFGSIENVKLKKVDTNIVDTDHLIIRKMKSFQNDLNHSNYQDIYNDASITKEEAISGFKLGVLNLEQRAIAEKLYWNICSKIISMTEGDRFIPKEIKRLKFEHAQKYLCNFSVFQSAPDSWAIDQVLPIVPITRLNEKPDNYVTLADITCDSDGAIDNFVGPNGIESYLRAHKLEENKDYPIGIFLTGAYQDIMGDMHNLFGRLNEVHVYSTDDDQGFYIEEIIKGQSCADVLKIMQYSPEHMCLKIKKGFDEKVKNKEIAPREATNLVDFYEDVINGYTYLK